MLRCLAVQLQVLRIGVTTIDPDSGPVSWRRDEIGSSDQYWIVVIDSYDSKAWHNNQKRKLQWVLDRSAGNTFGCHVSGTGELHLHHNGRDVGVAWEGLPTDQPLWEVVILPGYKVEANYVIAQSEAVCVSLHVQLATEVEGAHSHDMYTAPYFPLGHHSRHVSVNCCSLALLGTCMLYTSCRTPPGLCWQDLPLCGEAPRVAGLCSVSGTSPRPSAGQLLWEHLLLTVHREVEDQIQLLPYLQEHTAVKAPFLRL